MSEELLQRGLLTSPKKIGIWNFYNIGSTTLKSLKEHKIIPDKDYGKLSRRKPDGLITQSRNVIAVIENKKPSELNSKAKIKKAIKQGMDVAEVLNSSILIVTDTGNKNFWINANNGEYILDEEGNEIIEPFNPDSPIIAELLQKVYSSIDSKNSQVTKPKPTDPTPLAKRIWQDIWAVSGATPENCLYTFVELFIFKYLSDLDILTGSFNFYNLLERYDIDKEEDVLTDYASRIRPRIKELFPKNLKDNTTIINGTIFVSKDEKAVKGYSTVFKRILERFRDEGKLENIHLDFKSKLFESFLKESISKKNWGQFFTPLKVVQATVKMVDIKEGMKICDPACGVGKFLLEPLKNNIDKFFPIEKGKLKPKIQIVGYDKGFDKDEQKTIILAKANMLIYFADLIKKHPDKSVDFAEVFNESFELKTNSILGTLANPIDEEFDLILTNPPYVMSGSSNLKEEIKKSGLEYHYPINALGIEGLFMEWIIRSMKPGGKGIIIVPDGIMNRQNDEKLRKYITDNCLIDAIISLPENTFFTTPKKTYVLAITKKEDRTVPQDDPVFTYIVSDVGETLDVYRFDTGKNELEDAVVLYNQFKGAKKHFKSTDARCKVQPFDMFKPKEHWSVDRWWTKEEKTELGILEEETPYSISDFGSYLTDTANSIQEYQALLEQLKSEQDEKEITFQEISLSDNKYFDLFIGKRIVKRDLVKILDGTIPAYSANVFEPFGLIKNSNISNFKNNFVLWGIDGTFDFNVIEKNNPFATTDHCGCIRIKDDSILPYYLVSVLEQTSHLYGFDRGLRASLTNMKKVKIKIPVDKKGNFDSTAQEEITKKYLAIQEIKKMINEKFLEIQKAKIDLT
jgi:type I restriction enzyme M protein